MIDRRNRAVLAVIAVILIAGAGLAICLGAGVFGTTRADQSIVDHTVSRWWNQGGWVSYAIVDAAGVILVAAGLAFALGQLRRNDGRDHMSNVTVEHHEPQRGDTTLRARAAVRSLEHDLATVPDVHDATVGFFGRPPDVELRAVVAVGDDTDLAALPGHVDSVLARLAHTTGIAPEPIQITVRFKDKQRQRQVT
ncbi:MAG: alkaline shock response membrane anchor protein AmaP [Actinomycetota bacterium]|nr:alkaline shock response membrane anchor protein AmaP [Actinomycetota bacterium]